MSVRHVRLVACPECGSPRPRGRGCNRCGWRPAGTRRDLRTRASRKRNAAAVEAWVAEHGWVCPGWRRPPHPSRDLTADHVDAVAAGGDPNGALAVLCRPCNSAKGANKP